MRVNKGIFLGAMGGGIVLGMILVFVGIGAAILGAAGAGSSGDSDAAQSAATAAAAGGMGIAMLGYLCFLGAAVAYVVLLYKAWSAINDGQARSTPGKAVGFLFIPFFNLYWIFQAIWGWAQDYNKYIARHNLVNAPKMNEQMFLFQPISQLAAIIPLLGILAALAHIVLLFLNASKICDGINAIADAAPQAALPAPVAVG
jgi:hypothetical protein